MLIFPFQTQYCGWGVEAAESIKKEEFVIEYIGEGKFGYLDLDVLLYIFSTDLQLIRTSHEVLLG